MDYTLTELSEKLTPDNEKAVREFVERQYNQMRGPLLGYLKKKLMTDTRLKTVRSGEEEDLVQSTFLELQAWVTTNTVYPKDSREWRNLIYTIATRQLNPHQRAGKRRIKVSGESGQGESTSNDRRPLANIPDKELDNNYSRLFEVLASFELPEQRILREFFLSKKTSLEIGNEFDSTQRHIKELEKQFYRRFQQASSD